MSDYAVFNRLIGDFSGEIVEAQGIRRRDNFIRYEMEKAHTSLAIKQGIRASFALGALAGGISFLASPNPSTLVGTVACVLGANFVNNAMKLTFFGSLEK